MRHVGNRDDQPKAAAATRFAIHSVVEVARVFTVDRDQRQSRRSTRPATLARVTSGSTARLHAARVRQFVRQAVTGNRHFHDQRRLQPLAKHREHATPSATLRGRRIGDFDHHDLPDVRPAPSRRDHHVLMQAPVIRHHQRHAVLDRPRGRPAAMSGAPALRRSRPACARAGHADHAGEHAIAMHDLAHFVGDRNRSSPPSSGRRKPKPSRSPCTRPGSGRASERRHNRRGDRAATGHRAPSPPAAWPALEIARIVHQIQRLGDVVPSAAAALASRRESPRGSESGAS